MRACANNLEAGINQYLDTLKPVGDIWIGVSHQLHRLNSVKEEEVNGLIDSNNAKIERREIFNATISLILATTKEDLV